MKRIILFIFFGFLSAPSFSQSLEGEWKGYFETTATHSMLGRTGAGITQINLKFMLNKDSTYTVFSYTKFNKHDTTVICKVTGEFVKDSIHLREVAVILPNNYSYPCFQEMFLKIKRKKKAMELRGIWGSQPDNCDSGGTIYFRKKAD